MELKLQNCQDFFNSANKANKILELENKKLEEKVRTLKEMLTTYAHLKQPSNPEPHYHQPQQLHLQRQEQIPINQNYQIAQENPHVNVKDESESDEDEELNNEDLQDAEIIEDEANQQVIEHNTFQQMVKHLLEKEKECSKVDEEMEEEKQNGNSTSKIQYQPSEDMLCVACQNKRKEIMIQTCKHLVFCKECEA